MIPARILRAHPTRQFGFLGRRNVVSQRWGARRSATVLPGHVRFSSNKSAADKVIEEIQDQYATAKDEFDIAIEETEKQTVYAGEDRKAAREELDKLNKVYRDVVDGADKDLAEEVKSRIGQRIRELDNAVKNMEELAVNQD